MSSVERYDAKRALQHPFITRNLEDSIPLTKAKELDYINYELSLSKAFRTAAFMSIVKNYCKNLEAPSREGGPYFTPPSISAPFDPAYKERIQLANNGHYRLLSPNSEQLP